MQHYDSLREKLALPFVLLAFGVSSTLSLFAFGLVAHIEERAILRTLQVELESFRNRYTLSADTLPIRSALLRGYFLSEIPQYPFPQPLPGGDHAEIREFDGITYSVMRAEVGGRHFALFYDRSYISENLQQLALILLVATALFTLFSFVIGAQLARKLLRPIVNLIGEVSEKARQLGRSPEAIKFSSENYPADEVGQLVAELDRFALRLHGFAQRESYFAGDVSHELRTPVAVVSGVAEVLAEHPGLPDSVRSRIATIQRQTSRMAQILEAMLLLSQEGRDDGDPVCLLPEVIGDVVADCSPALSGRPVRIAVDIVQPTTLDVERSLVYVLVSNVLRNACAYTREGVIHVRLDADRLEVADTGIGIPEERFPELFRRHVKGEESAGHGMGLSIVARISERLNWRIEVRSDPGKGTQFCFVFPAARAMLASD